MKEFLSLAHARYSVRKFSGEPVRAEDLEKIIEAGLVAPTARNLQPFRIFIISSEAGLEKLRRSTKCDFGTKTALLVCASRSESWKRPFDGASSGWVDASIVTTHMMLEAADLGVGSTWVMWFDPDAARREFELPEDLEPVAFLVMGYPAEDASPAAGHSAFRPDSELIRRV
ncbi:MAG: nitroreductase family protein [Oscillospiraceae bacterium]|nr:nitroreductase family protein [Oscillospiraceae bacterium]